MSDMFDGFDDDKTLDTVKNFVNNTTLSKGQNISDLISEKSIKKTITINKSTINLIDDLNSDCRVDFSQMVRAGILSLSKIGKEERMKLYDSVYVPRNAGRKNK